MDADDRGRARTPAYLLVRSDDVVATRELSRYVSEVDGVLRRYGAEILVQDFPARVVEGTWDGFVTLLRFPDRAAAEAGYDSAAYQALLPLRTSSSRGTGIIVEGIPPDHRSADLVSLFGLPRP